MGGRANKTGDEILRYMVGAMLGEQRKTNELLERIAGSIREIEKDAGRHVRGIMFEED